MESSDFRESVLEELAKVGKALSDPSRLLLLDQLTQGKRSVNELAEATGLTSANASQHLQTLHGAGLVERSKDGLKVHYRIAGDDVVEFYRQFQQLGENHLAEMQQVIERFYGEKEQLDELSLSDLMNRFQAEDVTLLDVRPREEYEEGHLEEAVSIPLDELEERLDELPDDQEIAAYCRGPYCVLSVEAVELLRDHGFDAVRLKEGVQDLRGNVAGEVDVEIESSSGSRN